MSSQEYIEVTYRFGEFTLQPDEHCLFKNAEQIHLRPKAFQTLLFLIQQPNRLIRKDDLMESIWPDVIVSQNTLSHCVEEVRKALGDSSREPRFIETVPRLGYKFLMEVSISSPDDEEDTSSSESNSDISQEIDAKENILGKKILLQNSWQWIGATMVVLVILVLMFRKGQDESNGVTNDMRVSLAVLPLINLSSDPEQDYFVDGMTEELISTLSRIPTLKVIARTSVMKYKNNRPSIPEIAGELNVGKILDGSVRKDEKLLRITVQLIDAQTEIAIWSQDYNRELKNIFTIQADIAEGVAKAVEIQMLTGDEQNFSVERTENLDAYILYLKGRHEWNKRSEAGFKNSFEYFTQAIELDPNFALAYTGLADTYSYFAIYNMTPPEQAFPRAKIAIDKALKLDDHLAEAHLSLGVILEGYYWSWDEAEKQYQRAIQLNPNLANAYKEYSEFLMFTGRAEAAIPLAEKAISLDPYSMLTTGNLGHVLYRARQYEQAIFHLQKTMEIIPDGLFAIPQWHLILAWLQIGRSDLAIAELEKWKSAIPNNRDINVFLASSYAMAGNLEKAQELLEEINSFDKEPGSFFHLDYPIAMAIIYCSLNQVDITLDWLEQAYEARSEQLIVFMADPFFDRVKSDQRFQNLEKKMNLPVIR